MTTSSSPVRGTALRLARAVAVPLRFGAGGVGLLEPWLLLLTRVWLAQAFLSLQVSTMFEAPRDLAATLTGVWWIDIVRQVASSGFGAAVQAVCPVLLIVGLANRPVAVLMIVQVVLLRSAPETLTVFWVVLLFCVLIRGAGRLSLDEMFGRGAAESALPGARPVATLYAWLGRRGTPILLLALRLLAASVLLLRSGRPFVPSDDLLHHAMAMLPSAPGLAASLPVAFGLVGAFFLVGGLATRLIAFGLLLLAPVGTATIASDIAYWALLLGFLVVDGAGALAIDPWLDEQLSGMLPAPPAGAHRVVVVGAGFAGCSAALGLGGHDCHVTLIDRHNYHLFQPLLYQVATAGLSPGDIATPIRGMFRDFTNVQVLLGTVTGIDKAAREVELGSRRVPYDSLVLATGARHAYFGHDEWSAQAPGLKTIDDATAIRRRLLIAFEEAEAATDGVERAAWQTFVVVGGGPTGVEIAGAIAELARYGMSGDFRSMDPRVSRVILVQSAERLLPAFPPELSREAAERLGRLGVEVLLNERATMIDATGVTLQSRFIPARSILWAAGVEASEAGRWLGTDIDRAGRIVVGADLRVPGYDDIFAIGDTSASTAWAGKPVPGLAPAAKQAGKYVARVIRASLRGAAPPPAFAYKHRGSLATIGRKAAVADLGRIRMTGATAWWFWGAVHLLFLVDSRSRAGVLVQWLWDYLTLRRGTRLITGDPHVPVGDESERRS